MPETIPKTGDRPPHGAELVPKYFDTDLIVTPDDNPPHSEAILADLEASFREHLQLVPGWVCPSPDLPTERHRQCLEGNGRLAVCRRLGLKFWAFDLGRPVPEEERIRLMFHHNGTRRSMGREEIAERAARWMEITGASQGEAARLLNVSPPTLSRALGEKRILPELRERAEQIAPTIRSLVAAAPAAVMPQLVEFALTPKEDGRRPTRDQVAALIQQLKQGGQGRSRKPRMIPLKINGRTVSLAVGERDSAATVAEDLKAIVARLARHADVPPEGWPFLFQG